MQRMHKFIIFVSFFLCLLAQHPLEDYVAAGSWSNSYQENRAVPRYYVCGAQMSQFRSINMSPQVCRKKKVFTKKGKKVKTYVCTQEIQSENWVRSDGIRLTFCNYLKWSDQVTLGEASSWPDQGKKMCPPHHLVYGWQGKFSDRDGLAGLNLFCKNPQNSSEASQINVIDGGLGHWSPPALSHGFAMSFQVKKTSFNTDFRLNFRHIPRIYSFNLIYEIPSAIQSIPQTIDTKTVVNRGKSPMVTTIGFQKMRSLQRIWINEKRELEGQNLSKLFTESFADKAKLSVLRIFPSYNRATDSFQTKTATYFEKMGSFSFGQSETITVGQFQKEEIEVNPCTKKIISQIVYEATLDIPYVAEIGYTNGEEKQTDKIKGLYRGALTSNVQTTIDQGEVCLK